MAALRHRRRELQRHRRRRRRHLHHHPRRRRRRTIRVKVTATNAGGSDSASSDPTGSVGAAPPANTAAPTISGTARDGETLTAHRGSWTGTSPIDYAYQWQRCDTNGENCNDINGADAGDYTLTAADVDNTIRVKVTATNAGGSDNASSDASDEVEPAPPANTAAPTISGTARDGETLTADRGTWTGTDPIDYAYQWQRCDTNGENCNDINDADAGDYTLTAADVDNTIRVKVTATNAVGTDSASSDPTDGVEAAPPVNTQAPTISGTAGDGETLTADRGNWTGTESIDYSYQWRRCDTAGENCNDIAGADEDTYTLTAPTWAIPCA